MSANGNESRDVLAKAAKQSRKYQTLAKLAILKAKAPETYRRLMYLEAMRRGLTKPKGLMVLSRLLRQGRSSDE